MSRFDTVKDADVEHLFDNKDAGTTEKATNHSWRVSQFLSVKREIDLKK